MANNVAIVGAGVSGLTTAVVFAEQGWRTAIFAAETGPATNSAAAAAIWYPYDTAGDNAVISWALSTYRELVELSEQPRTGVSMVEMRNFSRTGEIEMPALATNLGGRRLQPNELSIPISSQVPARFASGFVLTVPVMDTTRYLYYLAERLLDAGGSITANSFFDHIDEVDREFDLVINCSGIGARTLVPDGDLEPHRGQVAVVPKLELPCAVVCDDPPLMYAIPRTSDCVFGGTNELSDNREPDPGATVRIVAECSRVLNIGKPVVVAERVGLRPFRKGGVCLHRERLRDGRIVIHNYGHAAQALRSLGAVRGMSLNWRAYDSPRNSCRCRTTATPPRHQRQAGTTLEPRPMRLRFFILAIALLLSEICFAQSPDMPTADSSTFDFKQFGLLAIQDGGRRKPIDTFARETLIKTTGRSSYTDAHGKKWQASDFVLSMLLDTHGWRDEPMILVSFGQLKEKLGLDKTQRRFSFTQLTALPELNRLAGEAHALRKAEKPLDRLQSEVMSVSERLALFTHVMDGSAFLLVPAAKKTTDVWVLPPEFSQYYEEKDFTPLQTELQTMAAAYNKGDGFQFSRAANQLRDGLRGLSPKIYPEESRLRLEYFYNHWEGFYRAAWCYGVALVLLAVAYARGKGGALEAVGVSIAILGLAFHASAITMRCLIAGRPPVTNMYESIIWVSFAVLFFGMVFFARYRTPIYLLAALPVSLVALLLVHQMPIAMPSSIDPLVPVLRDNFWLTIHVLTITLSYAAFALAMGFGHILLFRYARNPVSARADAPMHFWLYRVLQLGVLLLAAGTILGGVWANYSWGRFWGWDPKETWALIALLCYILTLHGRLAGWWTQFGLVVASVVCFLAVLMAWYGVNFVLGKGLHSYGFGIGGETYVATFVILDLLFVAFAIWRYRMSRRGIPNPIAQSETVAV